MSAAYPWAREKSFAFEISTLRKVQAVTGLLVLLGSVFLSPLTIVVAMLLYGRFRFKNDLPRVWSYATMLVGVVLSVVVYAGFMLLPVEGVVRLLRSFGSMATEPWTAAIPAYLLAGLPLGLIIAGAHGAVTNTLLDLRARRYLSKSSPTFMQKARMKKAEKAFSSDAVSGGKALRVGIVAGDLIPWRECRRGMIVGTPFSQLKHGFIAGANGTGKTITAMNIVTEYVDGGWGIVYPDFKGDPRTENMLAAIARERGVPFYSFWSNKTETGFNYDPVRGSLKESPASVLITAFEFTTEGDGAYYTDEAEKYLALQFRVYREFAVVPEEDSVMDWLLRTMNPKVLVEALAPAMGGKDKERASAARALRDQIKDIDPRPLSRLQANLSKVVNTIGPKMRPSKHMIDLRKAMDEKAIVYFGLPSAGDKTVMRALGALVIRDLVAMTAERFQGTVASRVPVLVMPDEASQLGEKAETMLEILTQGRAAGVMVLPVMQTFVQFTEKFIRELLGNSPTGLIMRVDDVETATTVSAAMGNMYVREERTDTQGHAGGMGVETQEGTGARMGTITLGPRVLPDDIMDLDNQHALVFFPESPSRATVKKPFLRRLRKDEIRRDIPITRIVSRQFILDAEENTAITAAALKDALGEDFKAIDAVRDESPVGIASSAPKYVVAKEEDPFDSWVAGDEEPEMAEETVAHVASPMPSDEDQVPPDFDMMGYEPEDAYEEPEVVVVEGAPVAEDFEVEVEEDTVDTSERVVTEYEGRPQEKTESPAKLSAEKQAPLANKKASDAEEDDLWG